jgi:hypothetical protein
MEVNFTPSERLVTNVLARYLAAADRGEFIEEKEMDARLESMFKVRCEFVGHQ